ncbi:hypothetical protein [Aquimarina sp. 2201CG5-10]|uniref:hypothetical protein n=1 Tax=Aquimarina callyspongiae TaxID=3098150 RepID=UPI002AB387D9|nr:hypothetical protein [Aquimarina sp. 2201CG5-10]MDY8137552.1 hypothetical protein [Aquimarina sp. 2201CG5-10]
MDFKQQHIRNFLRIIAAAILLVYLFDIAHKKLTVGKIYLDTNDGYVIVGCVAVLIAIEAVRAYIKRKLAKNDKSNE